VAPDCNHGGLSLCTLGLRAAGEVLEGFGQLGGSTHCHRFSTQHGYGFANGVANHGCRQAP
ncbi:MAG TPA: hypothetical protein VGS58_20745, partial [Candidatus Sulfopaludibacter sp.]|nr:hypothetical protein [Candidatus Sulfopaludibacter sp.]